MILSAIFAFASAGMHAQVIQRLQDAPPAERKQMIKNLSPEERKALIKQVRENAVIEDLAIEEKNQEEFKKIYGEYLSSQRQIKSQFKTDFDPEKLTDDEAKTKLEESFDLGEKLIENRRRYAEKMNAVMKPQQTLKMFRNEGMMREKVMDRRLDLRMQEDSARQRDSRSDGFRRGSSPR